MASSCLLVRVRLRLGMQPFASFKPIIHGWQTLKDLLQPQRLLESLAAVKTLAAAAKVAEDVAKKWLAKQALWQIYLLAQRYIPRPKFDVFSPNVVHQADLVFFAL